MPISNVLVLSDLDPILARLDAIELRLNGEPPPPPPPPPPTPTPSGDLDLGDVVVEAGQVFEFTPNASQTIRVRSLHCKPGSTFRAKPAGADIKHTLIVKNDAEGGAILLEGDVDIDGEDKAGFLRLATAPLAGDQVLSLAIQPIRWQVGDRLVLPDSRELGENNRWGNYVPEWERVTIDSIVGTTIGLSAPLKFNHPGRDEFLPHVGNLTRNVVIKSESSLGSRGYVTITGSGNVSIRYAQFSGLGRSTAADWNDKYPVGRVDHTGEFLMEGCVSVCAMDPQPYRWGVVNIRSNGGEYFGNVSHNWLGAGFYCQDSKGVSYFNNFAVGVRGVEPATWLHGNDASGFWCNEYQNTFVGNVAASCQNSVQGLVSGVGFNINRPHAGAWSREPLGRFEDNEAYGCCTGATFWSLGTDGITFDPNFPQSVVTRLVAWNCYGEGFWAYPINNVLFDSPIVVGGTTGWNSGDYLARKVTILNADFRTAKGVDSCIQTPESFTIIGGSMPDISIANQGTPGMPAAPKYPRVITIDGVTLTAPQKIVMRWLEGGTFGAGMNFVVSDQTVVKNFNGVPGDNFRVYHPQQAADAICPTSDPALWQVGSPEVGLRNDQALERHGVCVCGEIMPVDAAERVGIVGKVK